MAVLDRVLRGAGYSTWNGEYPSTLLSIEDAADHIAEQLHAELPGRDLYAVTHSLGGVVLRHLGDRGLAWKRLVMLAPPNQGSRVAQSLGSVSFGLFQSLFGPAGQGLGDAVALEKPWPYPPAPFAIIAGRRKLSAWNPTSWLTRFTLPGDVEHDGTVLVEETKLEGMSAFAIVDACHSTITDDAFTQMLTVSFLRDGVFRL